MLTQHRLNRCKYTIFNGCDPGIIQFPAVHAKNPCYAGIPGPKAGRLFYGKPGYATATEGVHDLSVDNMNTSFLFGEL
ncbi:MAG: hypothetical protein BGP14_22815 [Sphingobacteriales bacterium 44-15]|nr:MAG: hypothetical protein BGP14_22815 [Sphingobacteriales bacterium 44-15]